LKEQAMLRVVSIYRKSGMPCSELNMAIAGQRQKCDKSD
jgi:hypothetical protein